jgi:heterodisulfide reductase subunit A
MPFPQAVPAVPVIDKGSCRYFNTGKCKVCEKFCEADAIDFEQKESVIELEIGSVILAGGSKEFDARIKSEYGYMLFPNVITSIELERIMSASGPTSGHIERPSDKREPKRMAILQCVGSRDTQAGNEHCSAVCCMQSAKDAIIAHEHIPGLETTIFYMDIRSYGKGFDKFIDKAKNEHRTRFVNARVSSVDAPDQESGNLIIQYIMPDGFITQEEFELVVVSVGLEPLADAKEIARMLGIVTDARGFVGVESFEPVSSSMQGIYTCGSITGPKDIPESVMEASGAASAASAFMGDLQKKQIQYSFPPESDLRGQAPRIGVFVCRCGINIASVVDVLGVVEYVSTLKGVKVARELLFACAQDSQKTIKTIIREHNLNRIVVSACTPRTHEPLFQKTLRESGLNPYMFEFANIREQCSWVHQKEPDKATAKAKNLAGDAVSKTLLAEPLYRKSLSLCKTALVIGGGIAGITAALDIARQGYPVHLIEKTSGLGGNLKHVKTTLKGEPTAPLLERLTGELESNPNIKVHMNAKIGRISGYIGNFKTMIEGSDEEIQHGVAIVATGAIEYEPAEYLYGKDSQVMTQRKLEEMLHNGNAAGLSHLKTIVMIQCVGSRDEDRPYCSRVCCSNAIKNAIALKDRNPRANVYILYRDIRTYGLRERYYSLARQKHIVFARFDESEKPAVTNVDDVLAVTFKDALSNSTIQLSPDLLVLSAGIVADPGNKALSQWLKVPLNEDGFFLEAHVKLRPVDFATDGVFVCGIAHNPKDISETIAQARAAAGRAATILSKDTVETEGRVSYVREGLCSGCAVCADVCAYRAIEINPVKRVAEVNDALCKGCGVCAASCRSAAIDLKGFRNEQILAVL